MDSAAEVTLWPASQPASEVGGAVHLSLLGVCVRNPLHTDGRSSHPGFRVNKIRGQIT